MTDASNDVSHIQITPLKDNKWGWVVWFSTRDEDDPRDKDGIASSLDEAFTAAKEASYASVTLPSLPSFKSNGSLEVFSPLARTLVEMHADAKLGDRPPLMVAIQLALHNHLPPADSIDNSQEHVLSLEWGDDNNGLILVFGDSLEVTYSMRDTMFYLEHDNFNVNAGLPDDAIKKLAEITLDKERKVTL